MAGKFIALEGGEGSGKTTIAKYLASNLISKGYNVLLTREPGGVKISEQIRNIILDNNNTEMDSMTEAILYAASRRQHLIEKIIPALDNEMIVICDRFIDSSLAYQGEGRSLGIKEIETLNSFAITYHSKKYLPDLVLYLDIDPKVGLNRVRQRNNGMNRLDQEELDFHNRVRQGYKKVLSYQNYLEKIPEILPFEGVSSSIKQHRKIIEIDASKDLGQVKREASKIVLDFLTQVYKVN